MRGIIWDIVILSIGESLPLIAVVLCRSGLGLWDGCCGSLWDGCYKSIAVGSLCESIAVDRSLRDGRHGTVEPNLIAGVMLLCFASYRVFVLLLLRAEVMRGPSLPSPDLSPLHNASTCHSKTERYF